MGCFIHFFAVIQKAVNGKFYFKKSKHFSYSNLCVTKLPVYKSFTASTDEPSISVCFFYLIYMHEALSYFGPKKSYDQARNQDFGVGLEPERYIFLPKKCMKTGQHAKQTGATRA